MNMTNAQIKSAYVALRDFANMNLPLPAKTVWNIQRNLSSWKRCLEELAGAAEQIIANHSGGQHEIKAGHANFEACKQEIDALQSAVNEDAREHLVELGADFAKGKIDSRAAVLMAEFDWLVVWPDLDEASKVVELDQKNKQSAAR